MLGRVRLPRIDHPLANDVAVRAAAHMYLRARERRLDLPWKLRKLYLPRRGRGKHREMLGDGNCTSKPLTVCQGEQGRAPRGQCRTYFHVAIPSAARRIVNRSAKSKEKSDAKEARGNKKNAKSRVFLVTSL